MGIDVALCTPLGSCAVYETGDNEIQVPDYESNHFMAGGASNDHTFTGILRFKTPDIPCAISQYVKFTISLYQCTNDVHASALRYAICAYDSHYDYYYNMCGDVNDNAQLATGHITKAENITANEGNTSFTLQFTVDIQTLKPNTTYYLFMWPDSAADSLRIASNIVDPRIEFGHVVGCVHIDDGDGFAMYQCYIDNGLSWDLYAPYIDDGSNWDLYK